MDFAVEIEHDEAIHTKSLVLSCFVLFRPERQRSVLSGRADGPLDDAVHQVDGFTDGGPGRVGAHARAYSVAFG